jgi:hypothetical protein
MKKIFSFLIAASAVIAGSLAIGGSAQASTSPAFTTRSPGAYVAGQSMLLDNGTPWTPLGFTLSAFQDGIETWASNEYPTVAAEIRAVKNAWHGNTVRLQIEQDEYVYGGDGQSATTFRDKVNAVISYAEQQGLVVVINDQTEAQHGLYTKNEPLPTKDTLTFWKDVEQYKNNPDIILDPFNEPRLITHGSYNWATWFNGNSTYIGAGSLVGNLRKDGFTNQLWMEVPGPMAPLGVSWPKYKLPWANVVYSYHHTTVDQDAVPSPADTGSDTGWNVNFGNLVTVDHLPIVDGEWTNRSIPANTTTGTPYEPSGDTRECWGNAPVSVPEYLKYLQARGIGMTVWTLGSNPAGTSHDFINADGDYYGAPGDTDPYTSVNNYDNWGVNDTKGTGCLTAATAPVEGAGQDIMNWFTTQTAVDRLRTPGDVGDQVRVVCFLLSGQQETRTKHRMIRLRLLGLNRDGYQRAGFLEPPVDPTCPRRSTTRRLARRR